MCRKHYQSNFGSKGLGATAFPAIKTATIAWVVELGNAMPEAEPQALQRRQCVNPAAARGVHLRGRE